MSADSNPAHNAEELEMLQESLAFLHQVRAVRDLHPAEVERIRKRVEGSARRRYRASRWPAWAAVALVLVAGAGFALARGDLRSLPIVGSLFSSLLRSTPQPARPKAGIQQHRALHPAKSVGHDLASQPAPSLAEPAQAHETAPTAPLLAGVAGSGPSALSVPGQPTLLGVPPLATDARARLPAKPAGAPTLAPPHAQPAATSSIADGQRGPTEEPVVRRAIDPIVLESRSFAAVIERWYHDHDANEALALLNAHDLRYPRGAMGMEASVLRAELYLAQGRQSDALAVLDGFVLSGIPRARELATVRGELRVKAGRCDEARRDLGIVLEKNIVDPLAKRAMRALSHCH